MSRRRPTKLSREWSYSHECFSDRQNASIIEFEKGHLDLSQNAREFFAVENVIDGSVDILTPRVRDDDRLIGTIDQLNGGVT